MSCSAGAPRPAPSGALIFAGRDLEPRRPQRKARVPSPGSPTDAGRLAWRGLALGQAAGSSAPGSVSWRSHSFVRVLQMRKLKHKEIKSKEI